MKLFLCLTVLVAVSLAADKGPRCYNPCTVVTAFEANEKSYMKDIAEKDKKCSDDSIKYCAVDESCNNFDSVATGKVTITGQTVPIEGKLKMTHWYCGGTTDDKVTSDVCDGIAKEVQAGFDKMDPADAGYSVKEVAATCDTPVNKCDGKSKECVDMKNHPDHPDNKRMSDGTVPKMCTLLLAYPFLALMM